VSWLSDQALTLGASTGAKWLTGAGMVGKGAVAIGRAMTADKSKQKQRARTAPAQPIVIEPIQQQRRQQARPKQQQGQRRRGPVIEEVIERAPRQRQRRKGKASVVLLGP